MISMRELKVHIKYIMLSEFKKNRNDTETAKKVSQVYNQGVIIDDQVQN